MKSMQGYLLVAAPHLADPSFAKTVVLLMHHGEDGAHGLVLNRPFRQNAEHLWKFVGASGDEPQEVVNFGGPLSGPVLALHNCKSLGESQVHPGIYVAAERGHLQQLLRQHEHAFRLFIGHAGWSSGQLEAELSRGDWLVTPADIRHIFSDTDQLWHNSIRNIGRAFVRSVLKIKHIPQDVSLN